MYYGYYFDPTYILVLVGVVLSLLASWNVKSTFNRYKQVRSTCGMTGAQAAMRILQMNGINDVTVQHVSGDLTDHYDPRSKTVNLSDATYNQTSVAAIGVAAHECGHVMQHAHGYVPLSIRSSLVPVANFGSSISWPLVIIGLLLGGSFGTSELSIGSFLVSLGIWCFSLAVLFHVVTLPVEFNASRRALNMLKDGNILYDDELRSARKVLGAAALTYVAGALSALLQLLRLILISRRRD